MWRKDKIPYGTYYAFEELAQVFPNAEIIIDKESPLASSDNIFRPTVSDAMQKIGEHKGRTFQFILNSTVHPSEDELNALMNYVYEGNQLFISSFSIGENLLDSLHLKAGLDSHWEKNSDSMELSVVHPITLEEENFAYPGFSYDNYFSKIDTEFVRILGRDINNKPNFIRISYESGGAIYLHLAPLAFSNFFLLHKNNKNYYDAALSYIPGSTELVVWNEYFRHHQNGSGEGQRSSSTGRIFGWMASQPPLLWALLLLLALFLLIYLFESKRKQREIPERKPLKNATLEFVKTIGSLYYQRRDNKNLAGKMTAHFMDHVRNRFNIPTSRMDEEFVSRLSYKTGIESNLIHEIVYQAKFLADQTDVSDQELLSYDQQLQNFYKQV